MTSCKAEPKLIGVAVIGTGHIGARHLECLQRMPGIRPVAVPKRPQRVNVWTRSGFSAAENLESVDAEGPRLAVIASDTSTHVSDAVDALGRGYHLLVEKPLGIGVREALEIRTAAERAHRLVFTGCVLRFSESLNVFREQLTGLGRIHSVQIRCQSYLPDWRPQRSYHESYSARSTEGGVLRDLIHEVDYAGWLFGWPESLQARLRNTGRLKIEADESAHLSWETPKGALVSIELDYLSRPKERRMTVRGEEGTLEWDGNIHTVRLLRPGRAVEETVSSQTKEALYTAQLDAFIGAIRENRPSHLATLADGLRAVCVSDAARLASDRKAEERIVYS